MKSYSFVLSAYLSRYALHPDASAVRLDTFEWLDADAIARLRDFAAAAAYTACIHGDRKAGLVRIASRPCFASGYAQVVELSTRHPDIFPPLCLYIPDWLP